MDRPAAMRRASRGELVSGDSRSSSRTKGWRASNAEEIQQDGRGTTNLDPNDTTLGLCWANDRIISHGGEVS
jgi:hypothetical protein